jgi:hypothetical protein
MPVRARKGLALRMLIPASAMLPVALLGAASLAQSSTAPPAQASDGKYRISGTVVNAVSGEPIRRASVAVLAEEDSRTVESVLSDNDGRFVLPGLAAAKYQLTAAKRGFRTAFYDEHDDYSTAIVTGDGQDTGGLVFRLKPGAVLRGVVTADGGDPVDGAGVMLFVVPGGHKAGNRVVQEESVRTDDSGVYEFSGLPAGQYLLAVSAEPWYSMHRSFGAKDASTQESSPLDVTYPITFFDSTTDEASATPIEIADGAVEQANIALHAVPALHLFVETPHRQDGSIARPELRQSIFGVQISAESMGQLDSARNGTVEFAGVAPGHYELVQGDPERIVELDASASQQIDPSTGTPTVEVSGALKSSTGAALAPEVTLSLERPISDRRHDPMQAVAVKGSFRFPAVPPGKWVLTADANGAQLPVVSMAIGDIAHGGNTLTVSDRPVRVAVTLTQGTMRVEGFAKKNGKGFAGAMIVLVPRDLPGIRELARRDQSDSDGSFALRDVAPGQYTAIAIQDGWDLDWTQPDVISRFLSRGVLVTVTDQPQKRLSLSRAVEVQSP